MAGGQETHSHEKTKETHVGESQEEDSKKTNIDNNKQAQDGEEREKEVHSVKEKPHTSIDEGEKVEKEANQGEPSLEETGHHTDEAQEKSIELAIRNAEEKYAQAKEAGSAAVHDVKECVVHGLGAASYYATAKSLAAKDTTLQKGEQVYNYTSEKLRDAGKTASDYTGKKVREAKDVVVSIGESAVHYAGEKAVEDKDIAKELAVQKAVEAKDVVVNYISENAVHYVGEKAVEAKDVAVHVGKDAVSYAGEKIIKAKDATLDVGNKVSSEASSGDLLSVDSLKKERDFYLAKLQDIENVCQYSSETEKLPVISTIQKILEAKDLVTLAEAQAMISQQQLQNDQLEVVVAAEDKTKSENRKRKNILSDDEVDAAANTNLSPRQRISDASSDVHCIGSPLMNTCS